MSFSNANNAEGHSQLAAWHRYMHEQTGDPAHKDAEEQHLVAMDAHLAGNPSTAASGHALATTHKLVGQRKAVIGEGHFTRSHVLSQNANIATQNLTFYDELKLRGENDAQRYIDASNQHKLAAGAIRVAHHLDPSSFEGSTLNLNHHTQYQKMHEDEAQRIMNRDTEKAISMLKSMMKDIEKSLVVRGAPEEVENLDSLHKPDHAYRGMTHEEYSSTVGAGKGVKSRGDYSHPSEGTCFGDHPSVAESYINVGRDDPRKTRKPTYLVEVKRSERLKIDPRDGYLKTMHRDVEIPREHITRVWQMQPHEDKIHAVSVEKAIPEMESGTWMEHAARMQAAQRGQERFTSPIESHRQLAAYHHEQFERTKDPAHKDAEERHNVAMDAHMMGHPKAHIVSSHALRGTAIASPVAGDRFQSGSDANHHSIEAMLHLSEVGRDPQRRKVEHILPLLGMQSASPRTVDLINASPEEHARAAHLHRAAAGAYRIHFHNLQEHPGKYPSWISAVEAKHHIDHHSRKAIEHEHLFHLAEAVHNARTNDDAISHQNAIYAAKDLENLPMEHHIPELREYANKRAKLHAGRIKELGGDPIMKSLSAANRGPFVWHVSVNHPNRTAGEEAFGKWVHGHPMHEHDQEWAAFRAATRVPEVPIPDPQREYADGSKQYNLEPDLHMEQEDPEVTIPESDPQVAKSLIEEMMERVA